MALAACQPEGGTHFLSRCWLLSAVDTRLYGLADWPRGRPLIGQRSNSKPLSLTRLTVSLSRRSGAGNAHERQSETCQKPLHMPSSCGIGAENRREERDRTKHGNTDDTAQRNVLQRGCPASNFFWTRLLFIKNGCTDPMN